MFSDLFFLRRPLPPGLSTPAHCAKATGSSQGPKTELLPPMAKGGFKLAKPFGGEHLSGFMWFLRVFAFAFGASF